MATSAIGERDVMSLAVDRLGSNVIDVSPLTKNSMGFRLCVVGRVSTSF